MVKAKGKSMEPRIFEGDFVIARKTNELQNGGIYVCINNEEALIKKIERDEKNTILISINSEFKPFIAAEDFRIQGEVKGIISRNI